MRRRTLVRAVVSLAAGLAITLAVATILSLRILPEPTPTTRVTFDWDHPYGAGWLMTVDHTRPGWTRRGRALVSPATYGLAGSQTGGASMMLAIEPTPEKASPLPIALGPNDIEADFSPAAGSHPGTLLCWPIQTRTGWPLRAMAYWHEGFYGWGEFVWSRGAGPSGISHGREIGTATLPFAERVIPLQPLWTGLICNTLIHGGILFLGATTVSARRTARRRRRGQCVHCGYDLAGLATCPECGTPAAG